MRSTAIASTIVLAVAAMAAGPQQFTLEFVSIDGGGVTSTVGGDFVLSATIGQPDAGRSAGGDFELFSGVWAFGFSSNGTATGDADGDGDVDLDDLDMFIDCVTDPGRGPLPPECQFADFDGDGDVDVVDFGGFQAGFTGK